MRLGQLARKYNVNQDDVILFLNEAQPEMSPFHHNSKLSDEIEDLVTSRFSSSIEEVTEEATEEQSEDIPTEANEQNLDITENDKETEADLQRELDSSLPLIQTPEIENKDEKTIETDRLLELLETDEASNELSKITLIKAPKKKLSGLKVVGRIELAEPKSKSAVKSEKEDKETKPVGDNRHERQRLTDEEKEKRRLKAKEKKEQYEARQEKRRIEVEKNKRKAQNKARYEEKMQKVKAGQPKKEIQKEDALLEVNDQHQPAKPKSILGKFWRWINW